MQDSQSKIGDLGWFEHPTTMGDLSTCGKRWWPFSYVKGARQKSDEDLTRWENMENGANREIFVDEREYV